MFNPPPSPPEGWGSGGHVNIENRPIYMFTLLVFIVFFCIVNLDSFDLIFSKGIHIRFPMCEILLLVLWVHLFYVWLILCSILISAYTEHVRECYDRVLFIDPGSIYSFHSRQTLRKKYLVGVNIVKLYQRDIDH